MVEGIIFDIKKYAIHDGPGIRSTVFFKGCPLACRWCHNPEGITVASQRIYRQERCIGCGECIQICPQKVITQTAEGVVSDPAKCDLCQTCADHCPSVRLCMRLKKILPFMMNQVEELPYPAVNP